MARWTGKWEFTNSMHRHHGRSGEKTVQADSEAQAKSMIRDEVSRQLFGTTMMQTYVQVRSLQQEKSRW